LHAPNSSVSTRVQLLMGADRAWRSCWRHKFFDRHYVGGALNVTIVYAVLDVELLTCWDVIAQKPKQMFRTVQLQISRPTFTYGNVDDILGKNENTSSTCASGWVFILVFKTQYFGNFSFFSLYLLRPSNLYEIVTLYETRVTCDIFLQFGTNSASL
jgi:hypothetical protein